MPTPPTTDRTDRTLLAEIILIVGLLVLTIFLYWRPAADGVLAPRWWHWLVLGTLFFAIAWLHTWRRRRLGHKALHRVIREESPQLVANSVPPAGGAPNSNELAAEAEPEIPFEPDSHHPRPVGDRPEDQPI